MDAVIIGAGVMGCAIAFELSKAGYQTLNVDAGMAAGAGSTSSSSACIRFHYSTWDSVLLAWEAHALSVDWSRYLGVEDEAGVARFIRTGGRPLPFHACLTTCGVLEQARNALAQATAAARSARRGP